MSPWLRFFALALCLAPGLALAQAESVRPGVNRNYENPDYDRWRSVFERPGREVFDRRFDIVQALDLKSGERVADVGAGTGLFTLLFARVVGDKGKVYAVDISRTFVDKVVERAAKEGLSQVVGVVNDPRSVQLQDASVDLVFVCDTYHHFEYPADTLRSIHRALRPGGQLVIIDFRRREGVSTSWVMSHVRAGREMVVKEVEAQNFRLQDDSPLLRGNYFLRFVKH